MTPRTPDGQGTVDRRLFMGLVAGGISGAAVVGTTALVAWPTDVQATAGSGSQGHDDGDSTTPTDAPMDAGEMDAMHKEGIDAFLANIEEPITEGLGAQDLEWETAGDTRVFRLTCSEVDWEVTPGTVERAMAYDGVVPGPTLRVVEGQRVRVEVTNELAESTSVHWHGQRIPNDQEVSRS